LYLGVCSHSFSFLPGHLRQEQCGNPDEVAGVFFEGKGPSEPE